MRRLSRGQCTNKGARIPFVQKKFPQTAITVHLSVLSYRKSKIAPESADDPGAAKEAQTTKVLSVLKTVLTRACVIYTVLITGVYLIGAYVNSAWLPSPSAVAALLVLSLWIGASLSFLFSDALVPALRIVLHFLATGAVFWLTFGVWSGYLRRGGSGVLILVLYTVLYALIGGVTPFS